MKAAQICLVCLNVIFLICGRHAAAVQAYPPLTNDASLHLPLVGQNELHILSPNLLEVKLFTTKSLAAGVDKWNFVGAPGLPQFPNASEFVVLADGKTVPIITIAFKRRPLYAPLANYDLRIENDLYLQLA